MGNSSAVPPANLGPSIGSISDSTGSWVCTPARQDTWSYEAPDSIVTCSNTKRPPALSE